MKDSSVQIMGDNEYEVSMLLQSLSLSKISAKAIACLSSMQEMSSKDLEIAANIRQPEVSSAMRILRDNEWLAEREEKKTSGKGRPVKFYKLTASMDEIITSLEATKREEYDNMMEDITRLRELVNTK